MLNHRGLTLLFKKTRHSIAEAAKELDSQQCLLQRDIQADIGKDRQFEELKRKGIKDIFFANIQRAKESMRVLEEFAKIIDKNIALRFKAIRYRIYELEKRAAKEIKGLRNS